MHSVSYTHLDVYKRQEFLGKLVEVNVMQQLLDRFGAHLRLETLIAVRFDRFSVFSLGQYLFIGKGGRARIDYDVCRKIKYRCV